MAERPLEAGIHRDLSGQMDYGEYLRLDVLLRAQEPRSSPVHHDEMLFIVQHHVSELWMKLVIHELTEAIRLVREDQLEGSFKVLARVKLIQHQLFDMWGVLETLTPSEYVQFRHVLGKASGFQSAQYRTIEFLLGNKSEASLASHQHHAERHAALERVLRAPSLYDEFLRHMHKRGLKLPKEDVERDWSKPRETSEAVITALKQVYEDTVRWWDVYEMAEKLMDVDESFQLWRFRHMRTVHRIIGNKMGTGGSSGVAFLRAMLDHVFFPELWEVRTRIERKEG